MAARHLNRLPRREAGTRPPRSEAGLRDAVGPRIAPFGAWESPFPIELMTRGAVTFAEIGAAGGRRWWLEGRAEEGGRQVLVRRDVDGALTRLTPEGFNARSRVHEYGGGAYLLDGDVVVVSDFVSGRLHRVSGAGTLEPLTPDRAWRFADLCLDRARSRILAIREDHEPDTLARHGEAENAIVAIDLADGSVTVLADGSDFFSSPRLSPDGSKVAWLRWDHPNLPWDGTELVLAALDAGGRPTRERVVAGSRSDWIAQPRWSPAGVLHFVAEPDGWMNLYRLAAGARIERASVATEAEFAFPDWAFALASYAFAGDGTIVAVGRGGGRDRMHRIDPDGSLRTLDLPFTEMSYVAIDGPTAVFRAAAPDRAWAIVELDLDTGAPPVVLARSSTTALDPADISIGRPVEFPTDGDRTAFGIAYLPHSRTFRGPAGTRPPLVVTSHGGPTAQASTAMSVLIQLFTSRGFAVLDVDYGGSTGYGRDYRKRLEGEWGVVDLADCVAGATWMAAEGLVAGDQLAIRGGSASGYTTLCAVTFSDAFSAGVSYFGIGDLETFATETHKFESRYLDRLIGPYPERKQLYHDRSPLNFADRISCPVLILQGADDRIVPPAQAEQIVDVLWERQLPHAYILYPGEDHGFRSAANIIRSFEAELSFYGQVFRFEPADAIEPVEIEFLAGRNGDRTERRRA